jgi:hypothetical protein
LSPKKHELLLRPKTSHKPKAMTTIKKLIMIYITNISGTLKSKDFSVYYSFYVHILIIPNNPSFHYTLIINSSGGCSKVKGMGVFILKSNNFIRYSDE